MRLLVAILAMLALLAAPAGAATGGTVEYDYVTVDDGTEIAVSIWYPPGYREGGRRWPALFEMDGYGGARNVNDRQFHGATKDFVVVFASVRGTGCSGGTFDLFGQQGARDGYDVIEDWIVEQPWSNGRVGITGHSYSGLTGFLVAETAPPHVNAVAVSGLIDDFYRGLLYMGGIPNAGFPVAWGGAARPALEAQANAQAQASEDRCRANMLEHEGSDYAPSAQLLLDTYGRREATPDSWAIDRALLTRIGRIEAPTQIGHQYQDEQTGPRGGPVLWERLPAGLPKRLVLSNGRHNPNDPSATKDDWLRCWVIQRGKRCGATTDPDRRVLMHFGARKTASGQERPKPYATSDFPAPETAWRRWSLEPRRYVSTSTDQHLTANTGLVLAEDQGIGAATFAGEAPNQATWRLPFERNTAISGPIALTLTATSTAPDVDLWVDVLDHDPETGELRYLQRGMQRGSLRAVDEKRSDRVRRGPHRGEIWRPYHPFVGAQPVPLGEPVRYEIEIFPLGHVFPKGHELVLLLHAPPANDALSINTQAPEHAPALVDVLDGSVLLPVLPKPPATWSDATPCGQTAGELCLVKPS